MGAGGARIHAGGGVLTMTNSADNEGTDREALNGAARDDRGSIAALVASARSEGRPDRFVGKRRWRRYAVGIEMEAATISTDGTVGPAQMVRVHNVSGGGIGFWSSENFVAGAVIRVRAPADTESAPHAAPDAMPHGDGASSSGGNRTDESDKWIRARVKHCAAALDGFLIGAAYECPIAPDADTDEEPEGGRRFGSPNAPWHPR